MPQLKQFVLPDVGEGLTEGEVLKWLVHVGDRVVVNQPLVEVETAKAAVELPSPYEGVVATLHAAEGDTIDVGAPLVTLEVETAAGEVEATTPTGGASSAAAAGETPAEAAAAAPVETAAPGASGPVLVGYGVTPSSTRRRRRVAAASPHGTERPEAGPPGEPVKPVRHGGLEVARMAEARFAAEAPAAPVRAKPPVRRLARDLGVDLAGVRATGPGGTVTRADVEAAASLGAGAGAPQPRPALTVVPGHGERRVPVRGVVRHMAEAMVSSAFTVPHVAEWLDVDVTRSVDLLERLRASAAFADVRVTPMLLVARAVVAAVARTPEVNATFDAARGEIVYHDDVNLGFAAATPRGLLVPNVKAAQAMSLPELAAAITALTTTAKEGRTAPADLAGGTFTVTNVGVFGVDGGTPIINPGESAILAVGAWRQRPWVHAGAIAVRTVCTLSLSFDHRFIDGATGSRFLADVASLLEEPAADLAW